MGFVKVRYQKTAQGLRKLYTLGPVTAWITGGEAKHFAMPRFIVAPRSTSAETVTFQTGFPRVWMHRIVPGVIFPGNVLNIHFARSTYRHIQ